jgi:hypothetical protein
VSIRAAGIMSGSMGGDGGARDSITHFWSICIGSERSSRTVDGGDIFLGDEENLTNSELVELWNVGVRAVHSIASSFCSGTDR